MFSRSRLLLIHGGFDVGVNDLVGGRASMKLDRRRMLLQVGKLVVGFHHLEFIVGLHVTHIRTAHLFENGFVYTFLQQVYIAAK